MTEQKSGAVAKLIGRVQGVARRIKVGTGNAPHRQADESGGAQQKVVKSADALRKSVDQRCRGLDLTDLSDIALESETGELLFTSGDPWLVFQLCDRNARVGVLTIECHESCDDYLDGQLFVDHGAGFQETFSTNFRTERGKAYFIIVGLEHVRAVRWDPARSIGRMPIPSVNFELIRTAEGLSDKPYMSGLKPQRRAHLVRQMQDLLKASEITGEDAAFFTKQMMLMRTATAYARWNARHATLGAEDHHLIGALHEQLTIRPSFSFVIPTYNTDPQLLRECLDSLLDQTYGEFEICVADDNSPNSEVREVLSEYASKDSRVKVACRKRNGHIALASNTALSLATGDFVVLVDHDDIIPPYALSVVAWYVNANPAADIFYSDEDKIDLGGERSDPHFKSGFNKFLMYAYNMVSHLGVYRRALIEKVGGFRRGLDGSQDYDLFLRCMEACGEDRIVHIPHVLYHWRMLPGSTALSADQKNYAYIAAKEAINGHFERTNAPFRCVDGFVPGISSIRPTREFDTRMSIIIPTRNGLDLLRPCIESICDNPHDNVEILVVDNESDEPETLAYLAQLERNGVARVLRYDAPFNFSKINNFAAERATGELLCFLNNDTEVIGADWLNYARALLSMDDVGIVGARLVYPDGDLQHYGVLLGAGHHGVAAHLQYGGDANCPGYFAKARIVQEFGAVTGACLFMRKATFVEVGGFEVDLAVAYNDIDLCLKVRAKGYRIVACPEISLIHKESRTRGSDAGGERAARLDREAMWMRDRWGSSLTKDPFYSPNLALESADFTLAEEPRVQLPWRDLANSALSTSGGGFSTREGEGARPSRS